MDDCLFTTPPLDPLFSRVFQGVSFPRYLKHFDWIFRVFRFSSLLFNLVSAGMFLGKEEVLFGVPTWSAFHVCIFWKAYSAIRTLK